MCLFAIDGTWSPDFNSKSRGEDALGNDVGNKDEDLRSNTRRFYEESLYPPNKKFYFRGPRDGAMGSDSYRIYHDVLEVIEREINNGNCEEIVMVGWSRGAAIISELTEGLESLGQSNSRRDPISTRRGMKHKVLTNVLKGGKVPPVKFVGLFDSVAMISAIAPHDKKWGEEITVMVDTFAHVIAGDRTGPLGGLVDFREAKPLVHAKNRHIQRMPGITHGGVGGVDNTDSAKEAYEYIRRHATLAKVP